MTGTHDLAGVHVALTTPFDAITGDVALERLERHADHLVAAGVSGLVALGPVGERASLTARERQAVVAAVGRVASGRVRMVADVSAPDWRTACEHAEHAAAIGADALLLLPPTEYAPTRAELLDHYRAVAQFDLPVIVHNDPSASRIDLDPRLIGDLAELDGISAVLEASGDVRRLRAITEHAPLLQLLCGSDDLALESALMGATGWVSATAGAFPQEALRVFELGRLGDLTAALPVYRPLLPLLRWQDGPLAVVAIKHALDLLELEAGGPPRPPRRILDELDRELVERHLELARTAGAG